MVKRFIHWIKDSKRKNVGTVAWYVSIMTSAVIQKNSYYDRTSSGGTGGVLSILKEEHIC